MEGLAFKISLPNKKRTYWMGLLFNGLELSAVILPLYSKQKVVHHLARQFPGKVKYCSSKYISQTKNIRDYFAGKHFAWRPKIDLSPYPSFAQKVLRTVQKIPYGKVYSYSWVAQKAGSPKAVRAVGSILAKNKLPLVIPCHRVIRKSGSFGRFSAGYGKDLKKIMIGIERNNLSRQA